MPGTLTIIEEGARLCESAVPGCEGRLMAEVTRLVPGFGKLISKGKSLIAPPANAGESAVMHDLAITGTQDFEHVGDALNHEWLRAMKPPETTGATGATKIVSTGQEAVFAEPKTPSTRRYGSAAGETGKYNSSPKALEPEEEEEQHERSIRNLEDSRIGLAPVELTNQGLGARLWQFGTAGGAVMRERSIAATTGKWAPEFLESRAWLQKSAPDLRLLPQLSGSFSKFSDAPAQLVHQGISTQFAAGPLSVALRTDNVATCVAIHCKEEATQFLGHADAMIHHNALTEALHIAGVNLDKAEVTLMPGPVPSDTLETILPSFLKNSKAIKTLRIIPFKGPQNGTVVAHGGSLYLP